MNFDPHEINMLIAALRYGAMAHQVMAKDNYTLIGKRAIADNQSAWAFQAGKLADKLEAEARSKGITIHQSSH